MLSSLFRRLVGSQGHVTDLAAAQPAQLTQQALSYLHGGDAESAIELLQRALRLGCENVEVLTGLGAAYRALGESERSIDYFLRALDAPGEPSRFSRLRNCGIVFLELGETQRARPFLEEAAALRPDDAEVQVDLAQLSFDDADFAGGKAYVARALMLDPYSARAHLASAVDRLAYSDYANGWPEYEWRFAAGQFEGRIPDPQRRWAPGVDTGAVCVTWEQGLGDQIMYASCLPDLSGCMERCVVECDERLVELFSRSFPAVTVIPAKAPGQPSPERVNTEHDWEIPMGSLPGIFRRTPSEFPQPAGGYLHADPPRVAYWRRRLRELGSGPAIGVSWRGGLPRTRRAVRSIEPEVFAGALALSDAVLVSLQYGEIEADLARIAAASGKKIYHWPEVIADYDETAALVSALDLVLSVCTSIVHLAGALGTSAWVLAPAVAEWRYGRSGERMTWYDRVRLFRQSALGEWQPVIRRIGDALATQNIRVAGPR